MKTINPLNLDDGGSIDMHEGRGGFVMAIARREVTLLTHLTEEETKLLGSWLLQLAGAEGTAFEDAK